MRTAPKTGECLSPVKLAWDRRQRCSFGGTHPDGEHAGGESHHYPTKGSLGTTRDDLTMPICRRCHMRCHGETVVEDDYRLGPIGHEEQVHAVHVARSRFINEASLQDRQQFFRDIEAWAEAREASLPVPF